MSLTLPCVAGPYTTISCTLRSLKNGIRVDTTIGDNGYPRNTDEAGLPADDPRFVENNILVKAIAASGGQNDSGLFEPSFRDERYLPFEGAGVISEWSLELFNDAADNDDADPFGRALREFDYSTISDAILHVRYTAREDAGAFKNGAIAHLRAYFAGDYEAPSFRMFNLRQEFPSQWHRFLHPTDPAKSNVFELEMSPALFPLRDHGKTLKLASISLLARCAQEGSYTVDIPRVLPEPPPEPVIVMTLTSVAKYGGLHVAESNLDDVSVNLEKGQPPVKWQAKMNTLGVSL